VENGSSSAFSEEGVKIFEGTGQGETFGNFFCSLWKGRETHVISFLSPVP
jgi:hypothetical protein